MRAGRRQRGDRDHGESGRERAADGQRDAPANGATFTAPATFTIGATASDPGGSVTLVEFFQGTTKLGQDATAPYSFSWQNVPVGSYV